MTSKHAKIAALVEGSRGRDLDAHYLAFFECFNRGLFFEAHEVLEQLWLPARSGPDNSFYKGLIQLAGAFVHLQKDRLRPAAALFKLARANFKKYPLNYEHLDLAVILSMTDTWLLRLENGEFTQNPLTAVAAPNLQLLPRP